MVARAVPAPGQPAAATRTARIKRGAYLVQVMSCNDCHTPLTMGPKGPEPDSSRLLSGHPEALVMPPAPTLPPGPWLVVSSATNTAWAGPWGVSFTANLTPDKETGLGAWTEEMFVAALRTGRHQGKGRQILPPMPWPMIGQLTDADMKDVFAYLQSLPPVHNRVPAPVEPPEAPVTPTH
jgi:mono/diheme cytochrome c family protein